MEVKYLTPEDIKRVWEWATNREDPFAYIRRSELNKLKAENKKLMEEIKILKVENKKLKQEKQKFNVAMLDIGKRYKNKD